MIKTDGRPTIAWADPPRKHGPHDSRWPRVAKDREQYKRELSERTKREALKNLS